MSWSDEMIEFATKLWTKDGLSGRQIQEKLNAKFGTQKTRVAVIAKLNRLGVSGGANARRTKPTKSGYAGSQKAKSQAPYWSGPTGRKVRNSGPTTYLTATFDPKDNPVIPEGERKNLHQRNDETDCWWPIGDPQEDDFHYCCDKRVPGFLYCKFHAIKSVPSEARARVAAQIEARKRTA